MCSCTSRPRAACHLPEALRVADVGCYKALLALHLVQRDASLLAGLWAFWYIFLSALTDVNIQTAGRNSVRNLCLVGDHHLYLKTRCNELQA